uniref:KN motif and ankyrin repeat domains 1b n=1 Tax=Amphilophus citrinellus TaxID=61819 RepID=A0A3Q0R7F1_AMPCI
LLSPSSSCGTGSERLDTEDCVPNYLEIDYSYQSEVDCIQCVDSFQNTATIKRLSLKRRPRVAVNNAEKTPSGISSSQWYSAESLSSISGDDSKLLGMSPAARGRPPLPPPHGSLLDSNKRNESLATSQILTESKPQPAARSLLQSQSSVMERAFVEAHKPLNQEAKSQSPPQPYPRRRLASFGGVSSPGTLSPFTGLGAYNQNNNGNQPAGAEVQLGSSLGSRGSTGCLRLSPQSSGRTTPVTSLGSMHLQHVRDQMVVALQRLKELEEQVKIIPILQVKISVLQEEKRQLISQLKDQNEEESMSDATCNSSYSIEGSEIEKERNTEEELELKSSCTDLREVSQLTKEMQALEWADNWNFLHKYNENYITTECHRQTHA